MKAITTVATATCALFAHAADVYVDSAYTGTTSDGSFSKPYKKIADVNNLTLSSGTRVLFKCGSKWPGTGEAFTPLELKSNITYDSYTGTTAPGTVGCTSPSKPVLTGALALTNLSWTLYKNNIYRADVTNLVGSKVIAQLVDQTANTSNQDNVRNMVRARFPNIGSGNYTNAPGSRFLHIDNAGTPVTPLNAQGSPASTTVVMKMDANAAAETRSTAAKVVPSGTNLVGAQAFVHSYDWFMASYTVTAHNPSGSDPLTVSITLNDPGHQYNLPIKTTNGETGGYWLEGQLWMLDAPGEWYFGYDPVDTAAVSSKKYLYVYRPNGASAPSNSTTFLASVANYGVTNGMSGGLASNSKVAVGFTVRNLKLQDFALDGMLILGDNTTRSKLNAFTLDGVEITRSGRYGIAVRSADATAVASGSRPQIINSRIDASRSDGITLKGAAEPVSASSTQWMNEASGINIIGNTLNGNGMETYALASIAGASTSTIKKNIVTNSGHRGIDFGPNSYVWQNNVSVACVYFNDCGALYTVGNNTASPATNSSSVYLNYAAVVGSANNLDGRHPSSGNFSVGIYLDDLASSVTVAGNDITTTDYGIFLHGGKNNSVLSNLVTDSKQAALLMGPSGSGSTYQDPANNQVNGNVLVSALSSKTPLIIHSTRQVTSTSNFATYSGNRYGAINSKPFADSYLDTTTQQPVSQLLNFAGWKASGRDNNSSSPSTLDLSVAGYAATATNMVTNGDFSNGTNNWSIGLTGTSMSLLNGTAQGCKDASSCVALAKVNSSTDAYTQIVTNGAPFTVGAGKAYMLSFDAKADANGTVLGARIGDLSTYDGLSRWGDSVTISDTWRRFYLPLEAIANSGANGARIEFFGYTQSGNRILLDNIKLVAPSTNPESVPFFTAINGKLTSQSLNCQASVAANCSLYVYLDDHSSATFPVSVPANTGYAFVLKGTDWQDDDGDGVPNIFDLCPTSGPTDIVDPTGCTY